MLERPSFFSPIDVEALGSFVFCWHRAGCGSSGVGKLRSNLIESTSIPVPTWRFRAVIVATKLRITVLKTQL